MTDYLEEDESKFKRLKTEMRLDFNFREWWHLRYQLQSSMLPT